MRSKSKVKYWLILLGIFMCLTLLDQPSVEDNDGVEILNIDNDRDVLLKTSGYWTNFTFIHITGSNWSIAASYEWCSGNGSWGNPYTIENMTINAGGTRIGVLIENSINDYFVIRNVTVLNAVSGQTNAGIKLSFTNNGTLINNNCSNYGSGTRGIMLSTSDNNTLIANIAKNNYVGIEVRDGSDNNYLFNNTLKDNAQYYGIFIYNSANNIIVNNTEEGSDYGINLSGSNNCIVANNTVSSNVRSGITATSCSNIELSGNNLTGNGLSVSGTLNVLRTYTIHKNNTANGKPIYYYIEEVNLNSNNFTNAGQIILVGCNDSIVSNLNFSDSSVGVHISYCNNITIQNVTVNNNYYGINVENLNYLINITESTADNCRNGIRLSTNCYNITITNNNFSMSIDDAIDINGGFNCTINYNKFIQNYRGIYLLNSAENIIINNTIFNSTQDGIYFSDSDNNDIINNTINDNGAGGAYSGIYVSSDSDFNNIIGNTAKNTITSNQDYGIYLFTNCNNNTIEGNKFDRNVGIYLQTNCYNNTIKGNIITSSNSYGIYITNSDWNKVINNYVKNPYGTGIHLYAFADDNYVYNNTVVRDEWIDRFDDGIEVEDYSDRNILIGNIVANLSDHGIFIHDGCDNTSVALNIISNNTLGGIYLWNEVGGCQNTTVWLNNFTDNSIHAIDDATNSKWDNGSIGNYWDNYTDLGAGAVDANDDNIGDIPYNISGSANAKDFYPIWDDGDDLAPNVIIQSPMAGAYAVSQIYINATITDIRSGIHTVIAEIDNSVNITLVLYSGNLYFNDTYIFSDGVHTIIFFANDTEGNMNSTESAIFTVDTTAPSVIIDYPTVTTYSTSQIDINATIIDATSTIHTVLAEIDNTVNITLVLYGGNLYFNDTYIFSDGPHTIRIFANDTLGFMNSTEIIAFIVDTTAPSVVIDHPTTTIYSTSQIDINATIIDATSTIHTVLAEIDNMINITLVLYGGNLYFNDTYIFSDGAHIIRIFANDTQGNMNSTETIAFTVDTTAPSVIIDYPTATTYTITQIDINATIIDSTSSIDTVLAEIDGIVNITLVLYGGNLYFNDTYVFSQGGHIIRIFANDTLGFMNSTEIIAFTVVLIAPSVVIQHPMATTYTTSQVNINVTVIESVSSVDTVLAEIDNAINITLVLYGGNLYYNDTYIFSEGAHTIRIFANNSDGLMNSTEIIIINIDTLAPVIVISEVSVGIIEDITNVAKVTVSFSVQDSSAILSVKIRLDDGEWINLDTSATSHIFNDVIIGAHMITINATDIFGHPAINTKSFTVTAEEPEPFIEILMFLLLIGGMGGAISIAVIYIKKTGTTKEREAPIKS